jgi:Na+/H+ antiporter NhaD/arsenite permease-like protein
MPADGSSKRARLLALASREWLLGASLVGLVISSLVRRGLPSIDAADLEIIYILASLFVASKGLERSGFLRALAERLERGSHLSTKLVVTTFFLSMLVTNDAAIVMMVPLTVGLRLRHKAFIVTLEAIAANAGSALTPFGNPQNLFIYWSYDLRPTEFVLAILPLSAVFLVLLIIAASFVRSLPDQEAPSRSPRVESVAWVYVGALLLSILAILRVLPIGVCALGMLYALVYDRRSLRIDGWLLVTLLCLFGFTDNLRVLVAADLHEIHRVFLTSAIASQFISNVPAALLVADFTKEWKALLWGVSVGGFGSLVASLANLIAYRLYLSSGSETSRGRFTALFVGCGAAAFVVGLALWALLSR